MQTLQQTAPVSDLIKSMDATLSLTDNGPVILMSRSKPRAVLVGTDEWDSIAKELARLRHLELCDRIIAEMDSDPSKATILTGDQLVELHRAA